MRKQVKLFFRISLMNKIEITNQTDEKVDINDAKEQCEDVLAKLNLKNVVLEINFVKNNTIKQLNQSHRRVDAPTDVLSFPQIDFAGSKQRFLGSLVISMSSVRAKEEELSDVIKHGILHLADYDHETDEEKWDQAAKKINCQM